MALVLFVEEEARGEREEYEGTGKTIVVLTPTDLICERERGRTLLKLLNFVLMCDMFWVLRKVVTHLALPMSKNTVLLLRLALELSQLESSLSQKI